MLVCYVEGDHGHLMGEDLNQQRFRTRARGIAHSFHMPWADIIAELQQHAEASDVVDAIPRKPDALKYMIRVHLRVNERSMEKALRQLNVRPYVLLQLLYFLIDNNHKVFRGKGNVEQLRQRM